MGWTQSEIKPQQIRGYTSPGAIPKTNHDLGSTAGGQDRWWESFTCLTV